MSGGVMTSGTAFVLLTKWPGSGASKTRLAGELAACGNSAEEARSWIAAFVRAAVSDLVSRVGAAAPAREWRCVLLYAPPVEEARAYFAGIVEECGAAGASWQLMPVLESSEAKSAALGAILTDATQRVRKP